MVLGRYSYSKNVIRVGFSRSRIKVNPPIAFFIILIFGVFLTTITVFILTKSLIKPLDKLYIALQSIGKGSWPKTIKEEGITEIIALTRQFNKMSIQIQELLGDRVILLSGIAHDLRTPLTQIHLALSMLPNNGGNQKLMQSIQEDLNNINNLITQTLNIGMELTKEDY